MIANSKNLGYFGREKAHPDSKPHTTKHEDLYTPQGEEHIFRSYRNSHVLLRYKPINTKQCLHGFSSDQGLSTILSMFVFLQPLRQALGVGAKWKMILLPAPVMCTLVDVRRQMSRVYIRHNDRHTLNIHEYDAVSTSTLHTLP